MVAKKLKQVRNYALGGLAIALFLLSNTQETPFLIYAGFGLVSLIFIIGFKQLSK